MREACLAADNIDIKINERKNLLQCESKNHTLCCNFATLCVFIISSGVFQALGQNKVQYDLALLSDRSMGSLGGSSLGVGAV